MMDVLRSILTEDDAYRLPMDIFKGIASCSSDIILRRINEYLDSPNAIEAVKRRVEEAYSDIMEKKAYYGSEELTEVANEISNLTYADINAGQTIDRLEYWKNSITEILTSPYAVAYIPPVKVDSVKELVKVMEERAAVSSDDVYLYTVARKISEHKNLFRDAPFKGYKGTPVKRIIKDKTKYEIILKGLDHLIEAKRSGGDMQVWRYM